MPTVLPVSDAALAAAAARLLGGEPVAFPTETVYGLGALATDAAAVAAVYRLKGRPADHPLIVHLPRAADTWTWGDRDAQVERGFVPERIDAACSVLWPGPLTIVVHAAASVPRGVTGGQDTVALRVPGNADALALLAAVDAPLVAPSANRFGRVSPTTAAHVANEFEGVTGAEDLLVLDGGATTFGLESTVVDLTTPAPRLLRPGSLPVERLEAALGARVAVPAHDARDEKIPRAPGTLTRHYAPATPLRVVDREEAESAPSDVAVVLVAAGGGPAVLEGRAAGTQGRAPRALLPDDPVDYARELYDTIRRLDAAGVRAILVERPPDGEAWAAVRDRLARAAAACEGVEDGGG